MAGSLKGVFTKEHGVGALIAALAACIPILTGAFALDARYLKVEDYTTASQAIIQTVSEKNYKQDVDREEGDLRTRLSLIKNRISYLSNKSQKTIDDDNEIDLLKSERTIILKRLAELEAA